MPDSTTLEQTYPLLDGIETPHDLRRLRPDQLPELCAEIRRFMLSTLSVIPGHLGANLGAVEITVAMHYVFDTPEDRIVWDVGHQAYSHKILTGRREAFRTLRQFGGIGGFPPPEESAYDTFIAGHASNSISAALGMSTAFEIAIKEGKPKSLMTSYNMVNGVYANVFLAGAQLSYQLNPQHIVGIQLHNTAIQPIGVLEAV